MLFIFINVLSSDPQSSDSIGIGIDSPLIPAPSIVHELTKGEEVVSAMDFMGFAMASPAAPTPVANGKTK